MSERPNTDALPRKGTRSERVQYIPTNPRLLIGLREWGSEELTPESLSRTGFRHFTPDSRNVSCCHHFAIKSPLILLPKSHPGDLKIRRGGMICSRSSLSILLRRRASSQTTSLTSFSIPPSLPLLAGYSTPRFRPVSYTSWDHRGYFSNMATATEIHLSPATDSGVFTAGTTEEAARAASEVLQEDMENHHVFFNDEGFHST